MGSGRRTRTAYSLRPYQLCQRSGGDTGRQRAVSASWDKTLEVWDLARGRELRTLFGHSDSVRAVAVTPDGQWAVSASSDNTLKGWDLASERGSVHGSENDSKT